MEILTHCAVSTLRHVLQTGDGNPENAFINGGTASTIQTLWIVLIVCIILAGIIIVYSLWLLLSGCCCQRFNPLVYKKNTDYKYDLWARFFIAFLCVGFLAGAALLCSGTVIFEQGYSSGASSLDTVSTTLNKVVPDLVASATPTRDNEFEPWFFQQAYSFATSLRDNYNQFRNSGTVDTLNTINLVFQICNWVMFGLAVVAGFLGLLAMAIRRRVLFILVVVVVMFIQPLFWILFGFFNAGYSVMGKTCQVQQHMDNLAAADIYPLQVWQQCRDTQQWAPILLNYTAGSQQKEIVPVDQLKSFLRSFDKPLNVVLSGHVPMSYIQMMTAIENQLKHEVSGLVQFRDELKTILDRWFRLGVFKSWGDSIIENLDRGISSVRDFHTTIETEVTQITAICNDKTFIPNEWLVPQNISAIISSTFDEGAVLNRTTLINTIKCLPAWSAFIFLLQNGDVDKLLRPRAQQVNQLLAQAGSNPQLHAVAQEAKEALASVYSIAYMLEVANFSAPVNTLSFYYGDQGALSCGTARSMYSVVANSFCDNMKTGTILLTIAYVFVAACSFLLLIPGTFFTNTMAFVEHKPHLTPLNQPACAPPLAASPSSTNGVHAVDIPPPPAYATPHAYSQRLGPQSPFAENGNATYDFSKSVMI